ncbi:MAG: hypothetical protein ACWGSQ_09250, partial [Longimicrobiales bacterium]
TMREEEYAYDSQLQMVWPERLLDDAPEFALPSGYALRTFEWGDEAGGRPRKRARMETDFRR